MNIICNKLLPLTPLPVMTCYAFNPRQREIAIQHQGKPDHLDLSRPTTNTTARDKAQTPHSTCATPPALSPIPRLRQSSALPPTPSKRKHILPKACRRHTPPRTHTCHCCQWSLPQGEGAACSTQPSSSSSSISCRRGVPRAQTQSHARPGSSSLGHCSPSAVLALAPSPPRGGPSCV